jgi:hypothetical protein
MPNFLHFLNAKKNYAIYVNAKIKYFIYIYTYKPGNLPAFMHISQKKKFSTFTCFEKNQSSLHFINKKAELST